MFSLVLFIVSTIMHNQSYC